MNFIHRSEKIHARGVKKRRVARSRIDGCKVQELPKETFRNDHPLESRDKIISAVAIPEIGESHVDIWAD
jgi:hypothetical protein